MRFQPKNWRICSEKGLDPVSKIEYNIPIKREGVEHKTLARGLTMNIKLAICGIGVLLVGFAGGCFSSRREDIQAFVKPSEVEITAQSYVLRPPDEIEVFCSRIPELNEQRQRIRPDGKVSFESIGEVHAAGNTCTELADLIRSKAIALYSLPEGHPIDVRVAVYNSMNYYVLGQVEYPGPRVCTGRDSLLKALADAQPTVLAWKSRIQVVRPSADANARPKIFEIDYAKMIARGDTSKNVLLEEGDIVYVPPTVLAAVALKVEEFVRPIGRVFGTAYMVEGRRTGGY